MAVILCRCDFAHVISSEAVDRLQMALATTSIRLMVVPDLCEKAALRDPGLVALAAEQGTVVVACHRRAIHALLRFAGLSGDSPLPEVLDLRAEGVEAIFAALGIENVRLSAPVPEPPVKPLSTGPDWQPWFPVIDYARCSSCRQCLSFCPFGVYTLSAEGRVRVQNPRNCKNNCPACARICPEFAIIFPKVKDAPIDGAEVRAEDIERRHAATLDPDSDIHELLARRRQRAGLGQFERNLRRRDAGVTSDAFSRAEQERAACQEKAAGEDRQP